MISPFTDAVRDVTGGNQKIKRRDYLVSGSLPVIDQGKEFIGGYIDANSELAYQGELPCVIFGDHTKAVKFVDFPFALGADGVKVLRPKTEQLLPEFLYHFMRTIRLPDAGYSRHFKFLKKLDVPLPPLDEQRRIIGLLDRAEEIRRCVNVSCAKAREIIPALFTETFGDPATNLMGWPETTVGEALESANYGTSLKANERGEGVPVIRMGNVTTTGQLDTKDLKHIPIGGKEQEKAELLPGDLLFNRTNSKELVGKTGVWDGRFETVAASYFIRLRVRREVCNPIYLWAFFNSAHMKQVLFTTARGAIGQANINARELKSFRISLPPIEQQDRFEREVAAIEAIATKLDGAALKADQSALALSAEVFG